MIHGLGLVIFVNNVVFVVVVDIIIVFIVVARQFKANISRLLALVLLFSLLSSQVLVFIHNAAIYKIIIISNFIVVKHLFLDNIVRLLNGYFLVVFGGLTRFGRHGPRLALTAGVCHSIRALRWFDNIDDLGTRLLDG